MSRLDRFEDILKSYPDSNRWIHCYDLVERVLNNDSPNKILRIIHLQGKFTYDDGNKILTAEYNAKLQRSLPEDEGILTSFITIANWVVKLAPKSNPGVTEALAVFNTGEIYDKNKLKQYMPRLEKIAEEFHPSELSEECRTDFLWRFVRLLENIKENDENDKGPDDSKINHSGAVA